jgi:hypothetical protein
MRSSVDLKDQLRSVNKQGEIAHFWYRLISRRATVPGLYLWGFLTPPVLPATGADLRAALVATDESAGSLGGEYSIVNQEEGG